MASAGHIQSNAAQLNCIEARDDRIRQAARAVVATQNKASGNVWLYGAYVKSIR